MADKSPQLSVRKPKPWVRLIALIAVLATGWHVFASFLWIAPYSENAREVVPGDALSSYVLPFFGQSWSVFAPEPINGDYHFNVRAQMENEDGELVETGWVSATDVELSMIQYTLTPPRGGIQASQVASKYKNAYDEMQQIDHTIISGDFVGSDWGTGMKAALEDAAQNAQNEDGTTSASSDAEIQTLMDEERRATAYSTQVAKAIWGEDVQQVQYRVSRQNVIPFTQRHDGNAQRPEPTIVLPGWRGLTVEEGQNQKNFTKTFRAQFERNQ